MWMEAAAAFLRMGVKVEVEVEETEGMPPLVEMAGVPPLVEMAGIPSLDGDCTTTLTVLA